MPWLCAAVACNNRTTRCDPATLPVRRSFHAFPLNNPSLLKQWLANIRRQNFQPTKYHRLCSDHFSEDCLDRTQQLQVQFGMPAPRSFRLKPDAVPTLFKRTIPKGRTYPGSKKHAMPAKQGRCIGKKKQKKTRKQLLDVEKPATRPSSLTVPATTTSPAAKPNSLTHALNAPPQFQQLLDVETQATRPPSSTVPATTTPPVRQNSLTQTLNTPPQIKKTVKTSSRAVVKASSSTAVMRPSRAARFQDNIHTYIHTSSSSLVLLSGSYTYSSSRVFDTHV